MRVLRYLFCLAAGLAAVLPSNLRAAADPMALIDRYCIDCHGEPDEGPKGDFSLTAKFDSLPLSQTGSALKKALDAIEGFEMPPARKDQPSAEERAQLVAGIRAWLATPTLDDRRDPGRPILRRLTRLEYNNTVRDLLGLETDVFMFSERLPFERSHFQPRSGKMPDRLRMGAREYGAKYPVLLRDASMPGDSRAEYGFANRGDAQNLSAVRLEQYVRLAGEIAFHPELLSHGERMQELFPNARFRQLATTRSAQAKPLSSVGDKLAPNDNVKRTADGSRFSLAAFKERVRTAFAEDRGGVFTGEELNNKTIAGKGGLARVAYGRSAQRVFAINPNEDWWFASFGTAAESSGSVLFANYQKRLRKYELTFQATDGAPFAGIAELGVVVLSRRGQQGSIRLRATLNDGSYEEQSVTLKPGAGADNTFVAFAARDGRHIRRLLIDGADFSGDYVLLDDLAFITHDEPNLQPLVLAEEPVVIEEPKELQPRAQLNLALAKRPAGERLAHFARRAFRREVKDKELDVYLGLYQAELQRGGNDESAMRSAIQGVLASPSFLYLRETGQIDSEARVLPLTSHELASRLSYFLWSSMPDDELFALADKDALRDATVLEQQVRRMLADRRAIELAENFYVQWLRLPELWSAQPDKKLFPGFYSAINNKRTLARDMFGEALLLFQTVMVEDRPVTDLLDADYTFINGKVAQVYRRNSGSVRSYSDGRAVPSFDLKDDRTWHRVKRVDPQRGGIITSPAVLTLTSFPHRTSSIRRGVWILDTIFNRHPPAPKVAVADIDEQENTEELTLRQKVELHGAKRACAVCHDRIDPPGFALENFDAIGRWREQDGDEVIDASGQMPGLGSFKDAREFRQSLLTQKHRFVQGLAEHLMSFALGRKLEYFDTPTIERIVDQSMANEARLSRLIVEIVLSEPFRHTRATHE